MLKLLKITLKITKPIVIIGLILTSQAYAAENFCGRNQPHAIDTWYDQAMGKTRGITVNMRNVQGEAYQKWDRELNQNYKKLLNLLNEKDKKDLKEAQRAWLKFMSLEDKFLWSNAVYGNRGTMATLVVADRGMSRLRDRVCDLEIYLEVVKENQRSN